MSYILVLALPVLIIGVSSYKKASQSLESEVKKYTAQVLTQVSNGVDNLVNQMNRMALVINADPEVLDILGHSSRGKGINEIRDYQEIQQVIQNAIGFVPEIVGFTVFASDGRNFSMSNKSVSLGYDFRKENWYRELQNKNSYFISTHYQTQVIDATSEKVISVAKVIKDTYSYQTIGYVLIDCNTRALENIFGNQKGLQNSSTFIISPDGELIYASNTKICSYTTIRTIAKTVKASEDVNFLTLKINHKKTLLSYYTSLYTGWKILNVIPIAEINKNINDIEGYTILIVLISVVLTFLISYFLALSITNPLRHLKEKMKAVGKGNFDVSVSLDSADEIGELGRSFDAMAAKINEMIKKVYQAELIKKEAELCALQAQINPHFLYNTLAVIDSMALVKGNTEISEICCALSIIFRYNVEFGEGSTIEQEIEQIRLYLLIQKARYVDRFDYSITVDPELNQYKIVKLLIQPVVENSIVHGLEGKRGQVQITIIVARCSSDEIEIVVYDNGRGMKSEELDALRRELELAQALYWQKETKGRYHVGLRNVNYRIKANYGETYGLSIISEIGLGTAVRIIIPAIQ